MIVKAAKSKAGYHYCWAGGTTTGPSHGSGNYAGQAPSCGASTVGFDCTGLTKYAAFHATGVVLTQDGTQASYAVAHGATRITSISALRPGDLVYFGGSFGNFEHSGVYAGTDSSGRQVIWDANTPFWIYGDGVMQRRLDAQYNFVGAVRF